MPTKRIPAYLFYKCTGQARVRIDGRDHYLGPYRSSLSRDRYEDLITEWFARQNVERATLKQDDEFPSSGALAEIARTEQ